MSVSACCFPSLLGRISYLWRLAPPTLPRPRPLPATPRPPIPPIDVFPPVVLPPPGRPGAMFAACCDLYVLVLICCGMLCCIGCRLDQKPAEERGTFDGMDWQINATVATVTSPARVKGATEGLTRFSFHF